MTNLLDYFKKPFKPKMNNMKENLDDKDKTIIERDNIIRTFHYFLEGLITDLKEIIERIQEILN